MVLKKKILITLILSLIVLILLIIGVIKLTGFSFGIFNFDFIDTKSEPLNELVITSINLYSLDRFPDFSMLTDNILLIQGCGVRTFLLISNLHISNELAGKDSPFYYTTIGRDSCPNCTYHIISIYNKNKYIPENLIISANSSDKFILDGKDSKLDINFPTNMPENNNFIIQIIGGIGGNNSEILTFRGNTNRYSNFNFNCDNIDNGKCYFVNYDIGDIKNQTEIENIFSSLDLTPPEYDKNKIRVYMLNSNNQFEEYPVDENLINLYFEDGICKTVNEEDNPSLIT